MNGVELNAKASINDPNAKLTILGGFNVEGKPDYKAAIQVESLNLGQLGFTESKSTALIGDFTVETTGASFNKFGGELTVNTFHYSEDGKEIKIPTAQLNFNHSMAEESLELRSTLADLDFKGKPLVIESIKYKRDKTHNKKLKQSEVNLKNKPKGKSLF
jgi:hypothetical protein